MIIYDWLYGAKCAKYCLPFVPLVIWSGSKQPRSQGAEQPTQVWAVLFAHVC